MSSTYGDCLKLSIFGQSHSPAIGMVLDGIPAGLAVDEKKLQQFLNRRAPGQNEYSTSRKEADSPEFLGGILDGFTCGAPVAAIIHNMNAHSQDYEPLKDCPRPGHADFTAWIKYGGFQDTAGGGHFSGRLTAPLCIAGGLCLQWLEEKGIRIGAHIASIAGIKDAPFDSLYPDLESIDSDFPVISREAGKQMQQAICDARADGDSVGGTVACAVTGLPAGLGEPMFGSMESKISQIIYGIPAVKGLEFGSGFSVSSLRGSQNNDSFILFGDRIMTQTNHCGGILGGITTGMPLIFQVAIKPTPSIARMQKSISLCRMAPADLLIRGRHDPCIVPRAVAVVEAATAIAIFDLILGNTQAKRRKEVWI